MTSESPEKRFLDRTRQTAETNALSPATRLYLEGGIMEVDDVSELLAAHENISKLRISFSRDAWAESGEINCRLSDASPEASGEMYIQYDSVFNLPNNKEFPDIKERFNDFRRIVNLSLRNDTHMFDLRKEIGDQFSVYADITNDSPSDHSGFYSPALNLIIDEQPPTTVYGLYVLLHEVGHTKSAVRHPSLEQHSLAVRNASHAAPVTIAGKKAVIDTERNADAFALNNLRHFLGSEEMKFLHKFAQMNQLSYHEKIKTV